MKSTLELFSQGISKLRAKHSEEEAGKLGILRGGSVGCVVGKGQILGTCPKKAYLRMIGIDFDEPTADRSLMFEAGHSNEDIWAASLLASEEPGLSLKRESEIPIAWNLDSGRQITGRPDIVLLQNGTPRKVLELKLISSLWTARDVGIQLKPKVAHLIQAGHYAWKLGVPGELWYTSRADFAGPEWAGRHLPYPGQAFSHLLEYSFYKKTETGKSKVSEEDYWSLPYAERWADYKKIRPFKQGYELEWTDKGQLIYRPLGVEGKDRWTATLITQDGIKQFYELVDQMPKASKLPGCVSSLEADGSRMSYSLSSFCPLNKVCTCSDVKHLSFSSWMELVHQKLAQVNLESPRGDK